MTKEIINITDITEYLFCPQKTYLRLVKEMKFPPNQAMIKGQYKHKVFDIFNKNDQSLVSSINSQLNEKEISSLYQNLLSEIIKDTFSAYQYIMKKFSIKEQEFAESVNKVMKTEIGLRTKAVKETIEKGHLGKELWINLSPKYITEFKLQSENLGLRGRIDRIKISDSIFPVEIKTREGIFESDKIQLAAYALLLEEEFKKPIEKGIIEVENKSEEIELTSELKNKVLEVAEIIREMKKTGTQPNLPSNFNKCKSCSLNETCWES